MAKVGYPHEYRWPLSPGNHTVAAAMVRRSRVSEPVTVVVAP
jgi:penicillin-binding protein 1C